VCLVRGRAARAQFLQREHQLDRVEERDHPRETRRRQSAREANELAARHGHIDEPSRDLDVLELRGFARDVEIEPVAGDEMVERIPVLLAPAVELDDAAVFDHERRHRIVRAVHRDKPELRERLDRDLAAETAFLARDEAGGPLLRLQEALAPRTRARPRGRRPR